MPLRRPLFIPVPFVRKRPAWEEFETMNFSDFKTWDRYVIQVGDVTTLPFYIHQDVWDDSAWRMVNFLFCERCGYPVPGKHGACHNDLHATYNGHIIHINGGWHDAADMSQQTLQTGEIAYSLLFDGRTPKKRQYRLVQPPDGRGFVGMDYVMKTRLGDGYRAQTWGTNLWTDGRVGTDDDAGRRELLVHNGLWRIPLLAEFSSVCLHEGLKMTSRLRVI